MDDVHSRNEAAVFGVRDSSALVRVPSDQQVSDLAVGPRFQPPLDKLLVTGKRPLAVTTIDTIGLYKVCTLIESDDTDSPFYIRLANGTLSPEPSPFWLRLVELSNLIEVLCLYDEALIFYDSFNHYEGAASGKASFEFISKLQKSGAIGQALKFDATGEPIEESRPLMAAIEQIRRSPEPVRDRYDALLAHYSACGASTPCGWAGLWYAHALYVAMEAEFGITHWPSVSRAAQYEASLASPLMRLTIDFARVLRDFQGEEARRKWGRFALAGIHIPLPPLLSILLSRAESRESFWYEILDLRDQFAPFRNRVRELAQLAISDAPDDAIVKHAKRLADDLSRAFERPVEPRRALGSSVALVDLAEVAISTQVPSASAKLGIKVLRTLFGPVVEQIQKLMSKRRMRVFHDLRGEFRRLRPAEMAGLVRKHWNRDLTRADADALRNWALNDLSPGRVRAHISG